VQVLKEEVRQRIRRAALIEFAKAGAGRATMNQIAARAELGVATLYNYYESKEALLHDVISPELAREFERKLEQRVRALAFPPAPDATTLEAAEASAEAILGFWLQHRLEVVVLLDRAAGTLYAEFGARFVQRLTRLTLESLRARDPKLSLSRPERLVLTMIFENTRRMLATLLEQCASEAAIREAFDAFWAYQLPGLYGFADALSSRKRRTARASQR
jgi:AcrR family transcriptional regulator